MRPAPVILIALAPLATLALLACDGGRPSYQPQAEPEVAVPAGAQRIELAMGDFCFYPQELHLPAGEAVQLVVKNLGNIRHEFMAGRELGGHGYEQDFFAGLDVQASGDPRDYQWEVEGEDAHGEDGEEAEGGHGHGGGGAPTGWSPEGEVWDCPGQVMERAHGTDLDRYAHMPGMAGPGADMGDGDAMGDGGAMDGEGAGGMDEQMDAHGDDEEADAHAGEVWELNVDAGGVAYLTFTVPEDYKGEWETGCFIPRHFERGMGSRIIVE